MVADVDAMAVAAIRRIQWRPATADQRGDTARAVTTDEIKDLRREARAEGMRRRSDAGKRLVKKEHDRG